MGITYHGGICEDHPELVGLRNKGSGECVKCQPIKARERYRRTYKNENFLRSSKYKLSATRRGIDFDLDDEYLASIWTGKCAVFGTDLSTDVHSSIDGNTLNEINRPVLDRIDNSKGYVKGNVVWVSMFVNMVKRNATIEQLNQIVSTYNRLRQDH